MSLWDDLIGQESAEAALRQAAADALAARSAGAGQTEGAEESEHRSAMTHAWLLAGPPGSGRINLALAFAAALLDNGDPERTEAMVRAGTHPDLTLLTTDKVIITIDEVRKLVQTAYYAPSVAQYRVIIVEDADRMAERTSNVLLKVLEEPPSSTVWILCAPSDADLIPTIRSRVRTIRLKVPGIDEVAQLLVQRDGVAPELATIAARQAQSHVGMAHRLATDTEARARHQASLELTLAIDSVPKAVWTAGELSKLADEDAKLLSAQEEEQERKELFRSLGLTEGQSIPSQLRSQFRELEESQKRRATRSKRDALDRILVDLLGLYRDILTLQLGTGSVLNNHEFYQLLRIKAESSSPQKSLEVISAVERARLRIGANAAPLLALEALLIKTV